MLGLIRLLLAALRATLRSRTDLVLETKAGIDHLEQPVETLRRKARDFALAANAPDATPLDVFLNLLAYGLCHVGAGAMNGAAAGYVSHLALDATTPARASISLEKIDSGSSV